MNMKLLALMLVALSLSCSDRATDDNSVSFGFSAVDSSIVLQNHQEWIQCEKGEWHIATVDTIYPGMYWWRDAEKTGQCQSALDFANWVKKAHPDVWTEYYATVCDTGR